MSTARQIEIRRLRALEEPFTVEPAGAGPELFGSYVVTSPAGGSYHVELRDLKRLRNACGCPDLARSGLRTCKHIEATLHHLRRTRPLDVARALAEPPERALVRFTEVDEARLRLDLPPEAPDALREEARAVFDETGGFSARLPEDFFRFYDRVQELGLEVEIVEEVREHLADLEEERARAPAREAIYEELRSGTVRPSCGELVGRPILVFDLETRREFTEVGGAGRIQDLGISVAVVFDYRDRRHHFFEEDRAAELADLLLGAERVIGFNLRSFDLPVLAGRAGRDLSGVRTLDLLEEVERGLGWRVSLQNLLRSTLGLSKTGDGLEALKLHRMGESDRLAGYCRDDVAATRGLFEYGREKGHVLVRDGRSEPPLRVAVSW
jgi:DEAD/DEAH box helicase domain-containing protein